MPVRKNKWQCVKCGMNYIIPMDEVYEFCYEVVDRSLPAPAAYCGSTEFVKVGEVIDRV